MALLDIFIITTYLIVIVGAGFWFGRKEKDTRDFFVGNRQIPWLVVLCSIVATEISAATFLGVPAVGFGENLNYLQMGLGSLCARFLVAFLFISVFYRFDCISIYEYLGKRFGAHSRYSAALLFFVTRLMGSGVRLLIAATGLAVVMNWNLTLTIVMFALVAIVYTSFGGIKAIVWTDVIQAFVFVSGGLAVLCFLLWKIPGGWQDVKQRATYDVLYLFQFDAKQAEQLKAGSVPKSLRQVFAKQERKLSDNATIELSQDKNLLAVVCDRETRYRLLKGKEGKLHVYVSEQKAGANRLEVFQWKPHVKKGQSPWWAWFSSKNATFFWIALINGLVTTLAALGTDQDMTQRMLTCKNAKLGQRSLILSGFVGLPITALFLIIGVALYAYYQIDPGFAAALPLQDGKPVLDKVFPKLIGYVLPPGLKGLLIVGILAAAMSSLDSALGALSSSAVIDIYRPLLRKDAPDGHYLLVSRISVVFFGAMLALIAWLLKDFSGFLWLCFKIAGITYGALLGVFLLGITTRRGNNLANLLAMTSSVVLNTVLLVLSEKKVIDLGWTWLIVFGTVWTYGIGFFGALLAKKSSTKLAMEVENG